MHTAPTWIHRHWHNNKYTPHRRTHLLFPLRLEYFLVLAGLFFRLLHSSSAPVAPCALNLALIIVRVLILIHTLIHPLPRSCAESRGSPHPHPSPWLASVRLPFFLVRRANGFSPPINGISDCMHSVVHLVVRSNMCCNFCEVEFQLLAGPLNSSLHPPSPPARKTTANNRFAFLCYAKEVSKRLLSRHLMSPSATCMRNLSVCATCL